MTSAALIDYLRRSPSPFHAVASSAALLDAAAFTRLAETDPLPAAPGRYYLARGGSLIAWSTEHDPAPHTGFRVIGAHTDSPNLRIKPQPDRAACGLMQLGVEVYGGPILSSWLDRDLGLSGRVSLRSAAVRSIYDGALADTSSGVSLPVDRRDPAGVTTVLVTIDEPLLRIAHLAIHLDRSVNTDGLKLNAQQHLSPIWGLGAEPGDFAGFLAGRIGVDRSDVLSFDMMTHDVAGPVRIGAAGEFIAGGRMDNLATSCAGTRALIAAVSGGQPESVGQPGDGDQPAPRNGRGPSPLGASYLAAIPVLVLFDHEEVGSSSERGAASTLLPGVLERIIAARGGSREDYQRALAATVIASGDMAHATHPNYADRHEPEHRIVLGGGPVLKVNNQLRYASGSPGAAAFTLACEQAGVPMQRFVTRSDLPCGSTVGPMTAAITGAETVDFGAPMLSMHSARELVAAADQGMYAAALTAFLAPVG